MVIPHVALGFGKRGMQEFLSVGTPVGYVIGSLIKTFYFWDRRSFTFLLGHFKFFWLVSMLDASIFLASFYVGCK